MKINISNIWLCRFLYRLWIRDIDLVGYIKAILFPPKYLFNGKIKKGYVGLYNNTFRNERCIEIPIIKSIIKPDKYSLEIGNVLSHYEKYPHHIVDKYEKGAGVINVDILDYKPSKTYRKIFSISTFEHIGFDEEPKNPMKVIKAFEYTKTLLSKNGVLAITLPIAYNPNTLLQIDSFKFSYIYCFRRIEANYWVQCTFSSMKNIVWNYPFENANALIVGVYHNGS